MLPTKKQAEQIVDVVVDSLEATLLNNLAIDGFTLKLGSFGKFSVRHKPGIRRRIPFTGETILTKDNRKITSSASAEFRWRKSAPSVLMRSKTGLSTSRSRGSH